MSISALNGYPEIWHVAGIFDDIGVVSPVYIGFRNLAAICPFTKNNGGVSSNLVDGKYYVNLMIMVHHGFVDGLHVAKLIDALTEKITNFNPDNK